MTSLAARRLQAGFLLVAIAAVLWGTSSIAAKTLMLTADVSPLGVGFWRLVLAVPPLLVLGVARLGPVGLLRVPGPMVWRVVLLGVAMACYQVFFYAAVVHAGVTVTSLVALCGAPPVVAVLSAITLREAPTVRTLVALALAVAGTGLLIGVPEGAAGDEVLLGALLATGAAVSYATVAVIGRSIGEAVHPTSTIVIGFGIGALCLLPFATGAGLWPTDTALGLPLIGYLGIIATGLAYGLFFTGMRTTPATAASVITLIEPLTATVLAWMIFDERLGPLGFAGGALLVTGMIVLARGGRRA